MPKEDNLFTGNDARERLMRGVDKVADAVKGTLGSAGYNYISEKFEYPYAISSNDGVTLAQDIFLADPVERMGANLMKEIASRSDKQSADGTTTSITLAQAILHEGMKSDASPMEIKKSLEECLPIIEASIKDQTRLIVKDGGFDADMLERVATISSEDPSIGKLVTEIYGKIGAEGILFRDISQTFTDHYEMNKGIHVQDAGFASPYMVDIEKDTGKPLAGVQLKNPSVLVVKKINSISDFETIAYTLRNKGKNDVVIFCEDFEAQVLTQCAGTRMKNNFRFVVVKLPVLWRDQWLEDIAKMTGTVVIDGIARTKAEPTDIGTCETIEIDKSNTYFGGIKDISDHLAALAADGTDESKIRAARLNRNSARLFVGAASDQALSYRRLKVEDAVGAAYQALHGGVVAGGGVALVNASKVMPNTVGGNIMREALKAPILQICRNAGFDGTLQPEPTYGFNAKTGKTEDMWEAGIIDPANVVLNSVRNAISVAATVLSTKVIVTMPRMEQPMPNMPQM